MDKTGDVRDLTVEVLREIRGELREVREELRGFRDDTNTRLERVERGVSDLRGRFDHFLEFASRYYQDHETRIRALEQGRAL